MKTRLYGLLALVLCAMMVIAPAGALGADGDALEYPIFYLMNQNVVVQEDDIILDSTEVKHPTSSGNPLRLVYDLENANETKGISTEQSVSFYDPMSFEIIGWRVKKLAQSTVENKTYDTIYLEPVHSRIADGTATVGGQTIMVTAYDRIFEPNEPLGELATRQQIEESFRQCANGLGYGKNLSFRDISAYEPVVVDNFDNHQVIRKIDLKNVTVTFREGNKSPLARANTTARLLHMDSTGAISEHHEINIANGKYTVTLSSFSPFAIAYDSTGSGASGGGNAGGGVPAPSTPSTPNLPQTGDNSQLVLWFALAALSLAGAAVILRRKKA